MRKTLLFCFVGALSVFGITSCGGDTSNSLANANKAVVNTAQKAVNTAGNAVNTVSNAIDKATTAKPTDFLTEAAQGGMAEVEMGKLASTKAKDPAVKKFGQMMVADHGKANDELKALAGKKSITLPADIGSHKSSLDKLNGLSGADFDKEYVSMMVDDHETDVKAFEKEAENSTDADVKAFAAKTLPVLKKHLEAIKAIQAKMK